MLSVADAEKSKSKSKGCGCLTFIVGVVVLIVLVAAISSGGSGHKAPSGHFNGNDAKLVAATTAAVDNDAESPGLSRRPTAECSMGAGRIGLICEVSYTIKEPVGISFGDEVVLPSRGVFRYAFTDPRVGKVSVTVSGPTTSVGGKSGTSELFTLWCSRSAARQISWSNVSYSGLKQLCRFTPYVNGT